MNVVGNNLVNISTAGYKQQRFTASTFDDVMYSRVGNIYNIGEEIGRQSYIRAPSQIYTDYTQGIQEPTGLSLDFAINGDGFFAIQDPDGEIAYTRMGNFSLDDEGYLCLPGYGRVLSPEGQTIYLGTDKISATEQGLIYYDDGGLIGRLGVYVFEDNEQLVHNGMGLFTGEGAQAAENFEVWNGYLERSNVDLAQEMVKVIESQRAYSYALRMVQTTDEIEQTINGLPN